MELLRDEMNTFWSDRLCGRNVRIFEPKAYPPYKLNVKIMSIQLTPQYTRVDIRYRSPERTITSGILQVLRSAYLFTDADYETYSPEKKYKLIKAENIPIAPKRKIFHEAEIEYYFTLFFEPVPLTTLKMHLIEQKDEFNSYMNFTDIIVDKASRSWKIENSEN
jgi:hypothetical protein